MSKLVLVSIFPLASYHESSFSERLNRCAIVLYIEKLFFMFLSTFGNHILICAFIHFQLIGFVLTLTLDLCAFWLWICVHRPQSFGAAVMRVGWLELRWKWNKQEILINQHIMKILKCTKRHGGWQYSKYFCVTSKVFASRFLKNFDQNLSCWGWPSIFDSSSSWNFELHQILSNLLSMQCGFKVNWSPQKMSLLPN